MPVVENVNVREVFQTCQSRQEVAAHQDGAFFAVVRDLVEVRERRDDNADGTDRDGSKPGIAHLDLLAAVARSWFSCASVNCQ